MVTRMDTYFRALAVMLVAVTSLFTAVCARGSADVSSRVEQILGPAFAVHRSGGAVLVARNGRLLFRRAYGMANVELGVPMRIDHAFGTGSITKQFTAVSILQLAEQGRLSLDDDVRQHIPELQTDGRRVTIDQVLTHTSGLPNVVDRADFDTIARLDYTVPQLLDLTNGMPRLFEPGRGFHYSDTGYFILGAIVERLAGLPYATYVEERLFRPLGMHSTWQVDGTRVIPRMTSGYSVRRGVLVPPTPISWTVPYAAGGVFSTVDDLWRWDKAIRTGRVIGDAWLRRAWSPRALPDGSPSGYGYGWKVCTLAGHRTIEHGGFVNGFQASLLHLPDDDVTVIVLVNNDADAPDAGGTARRLGRLIVTGSADITPHSLTAEQRLTLVGRYRTPAGEIHEVRDESGVLSEARRGGVGRPLVALSPARLAWAEGEEGVVLTFDPATNGQSPKYRASLRCEPIDVASRQP